MESEGKLPSKTVCNQNWLVVWNICYFPFHIWDVIQTPLTNSPSFFRGVGRNHQPVLLAPPWWNDSRRELPTADGDGTGPSWHRAIGCRLHSMRSKEIAEHGQLLLTKPRRVSDLRSWGGSLHFEAWGLFSSLHDVLPCQTLPVLQPISSFKHFSSKTVLTLYSYGHLSVITGDFYGIKNIL